MSLDQPGTFTPMPGAAPLPQQVAAQVRMETRLLLRNGEQLLLAVVIPLLVLVGGVLAADSVGLEFAQSPVDTLTPGVLALAILSTSFASLAITTGFERRYGVLKRLGASPLPRGGLLAGKLGSLLVVELLQVLVIGTAGLLLGWSPVVSVASILGVLCFAVVGTAAFASLGLLLAGTVRAETTLAAANLVYLLLLAGGAVVLPLSTYGDFGSVLAWLPSAALGDGMRSALMEGSLAVVPLLVLVGWTAIGTVATSRTFRWE